jgi:hypothetical protein
MTPLSAPQPVYHEMPGGMAILPQPAGPGKVPLLMDVLENQHVTWARCDYENKHRKAAFERRCIETLGKLWVSFSGSTCTMVCRGAWSGPELIGLPTGRIRPAKSHKDSSF